MKELMMIRRSEKARIVAARVAERIREVAPEGLGHWGPAWDLVGTPSDAFMDRLAEWEAADSPITRSHVETTGGALVAAWAEAARQWKEAGHSALDDAGEVEVGERERQGTHSI